MEGKVTTSLLGERANFYPPRGKIFGCLLYIITAYTVYLEKTEAPSRKILNTWSQVSLIEAWNLNLEELVDVILPRRRPDDDILNLFQAGSELLSQNSSYLKGKKNPIKIEV